MKGSPLHHIIASEISLKLEVLGYIFVVESLGTLTTFTQCAPKSYRIR